MISTDAIYNSALHHMRTILPSNIFVVDGESYGVRQIDPYVKSPSVTVSLGDISSADVELGSISTSYPIVYTITADSRLQRDSVKDIVYSGLTRTRIVLYDDFVDDTFVPVSGSISTHSSQLGDYINMINIPVNEADRERFFWTSVVYVDFLVN